MIRRMATAIWAGGLALTLVGTSTTVRAEPAVLGGGALVYEPGPAPFKAYVREWTTPAGVQFLLDSPADHIHHHGLMLAINVADVEFWAEQPADRVGRQVGPSPPTVADGHIEHEIEWRGPDNAVLLCERRRLRFDRGGDGRPDRLTWHSELRAPPGREAVTLSGRHYFGLGLRFVQDLDGAIEYSFEPNAPTEIILEKGTGRPRNDERLTGGRWVAARGAVRGQPVTVALLDAGGLARPTLWFTMSRPFAFVGATLNLHREPLKLEAKSSLTLRWRVVAWDGRAPDTALDEELRQWATECQREGGGR